MSSWRFQVVDQTNGHFEIVSGGQTLRGTAPYGEQIAGGEVDDDPVSSNGIVIAGATEPRVTLSLVSGRVITYMRGQIAGSLELVE